MTFKHAALMLLTGLLTYSHAATAQSDMSVEINVVLTAKAAARLAAEKRGMVAFADYYAEPKKSMEKEAKKADAIGADGMVHLQPSSQDVPISGKDGAARVTDTNVDKKRLAWVTGPVSININITSERKSSQEENILDCDFIEGPLAIVQKQPITVNCGLIHGDHMETKARP
jgi:hypothetical protein